MAGEWRTYPANGRNVNWSLWHNGEGYTDDQVNHALLMDIREELKRLNNVMQCPNVGGGFRALIEMNRRDEKKFKTSVKRAVRRELKKRGIKS